MHAWYRGKDWNEPSRSCKSETQPYFGLKYPAGTPLPVVVVNKVLSRMKKPVHLLDITLLSQYRKDGHPSFYGLHNGLDCSHWCLPGLPDTWNVLLYAALFSWKNICLLNFYSRGENSWFDNFIVGVFVFLFCLFSYLFIYICNWRVK